MPDQPATPPTSTPQGPAPVAPSPTMSAATTAPPPTVVPPKGKKISLKLIIIIVGLILLAGSVLAYAVVLRQTPEEQIKAAFGRTLESQSVSFEGNISAKGENADDFPPINFSGESGQESMNLEFSVGLGITRLDITLRGFKDELFLKVKGIKGLGSLLGPEYGEEAASIDALDDQFIIIDQETMQQLGLTPAGNQGNLVVQTEKIAPLVKDAYFFTVEEKLDSKDINGEKAAGYRIRLDRDGIIAFMQELKDAKIEGLEITDEQIQNLSDNLTQEDLDKIDIEVWLQNGKVAQLVFSTTEDGSTFSITMTITGYDKPVNVERPTEAKSLLEVMNSLQFLLGGFVPFGSLPAAE